MHSVLMAAALRLADMTLQDAQTTRSYTVLVQREPPPGLMVPTGPMAQLRMTLERDGESATLNEHVATAAFDGSNVPPPSLVRYRKATTGMWETGFCLACTTARAQQFQTLNPPVPMSGFQIRPGTMAFGGTDLALHIASVVRSGRDQPASNTVVIGTLTRRNAGTKLWLRISFQDSNLQSFEVLEMPSSGNDVIAQAVLTPEDGASRTIPFVFTACYVSMLFDGRGFCV